ncbi:MAG: response regulator [Anaeromyxobacter sp.]|nr:response regulator [Anaeromyxobacter sp.]MBL0278097.1 response regulator [Anaeromyxobacter sp.]
MHVERRPLLLALTVLAGVLAAGALLVTHLAGLDRQERRRSATDLARTSAFAIEQELARSLDSAAVLAALVAQGASDAELAAVATSLLRLHGATANLQLARDGVISHLWPLAGNEAARGLDLVSHPIHGAYVRSVRATRRPALYGPFQLVQGGAGLALRLPVFVPDGGGERFWGLSSAIIRLPVLLEASRIPRLEQAGFAYQLTRAAAGGGDELLTSSGGQGRSLVDPVEVTVQLPDQTWLLGVAPRSGWAAVPPPRALLVAVLVVALLAGGLAYRLFGLPEILRREVAARTAELAQAHQAQQAALEAQRQSQKLEAVGLLAGGVAHDFNNLLAAILGHADLLAQEAPPGSQTEEAARTIAQAAQRAATLTRQLLAFARLGHHRQEAVDLHALVLEATGLLGRTLDKAIVLQARLEAPRHHVRGDPGQLQQVIVNLAVNARDAMPSGGTLTLQTRVVAFDGAGGPAGRAPGEWLELSVTDTGVGIPPQLRERIFEPFFTTKGEGRGTGLGLATVYGIVKGHGGEVAVSSQEGVGSCFTIHLPLLATPATTAAPAEAAAPRGGGVVLVVDDEALVGRTAGRLLASLGYQPEVVGGGQEALDWLASHAAPPAAVLLDLAMPGMDGATCFRRMRQALPSLPVVITSGFDRNDRAQELLDEGAREFVQKPYRTLELATALAAALRDPA